MGMVGVVGWWVWLVVWWCGRGLAISRSGAKLVGALGLLVSLVLACRCRLAAGLAPPTQCVEGLASVVGCLYRSVFVPVLPIGLRSALWRWGLVEEVRRRGLLAIRGSGLGVSTSRSAAILASACGCVGHCCCFVGGGAACRGSAAAPVSLMASACLL